MKKRFLILATLSIFCLTSFVACAKEDTKKEPTNATPTVSVSDENEKDDDLTIDNSNISLESIPFGGSFSRENTSLSFYIGNGSWNVSGFYFSDDAAPIILTGPTTLKTGSEFLYSDDENEISFIFGAEDLKVTVAKGTAYKVFEGTYSRDELNSEQETLSPESGSSLELLGRISLTHYMVLAEEFTECTITTSNNPFDQEYSTMFLSAYADLFLSSEATLVPEVSEKHLVYAMSKDALNDLLLTASSGTFDISKFDGTAINVTAKDDMYYIPCLGAYAGGLTTPEANPELISDTLTLGGVVAKADGTYYDISMTLSTSENTSAGATGIQIDSITCKRAE